APPRGSTPAPPPSAHAPLGEPDSPPAAPPGPATPPAPPADDDGVDPPCGHQVLTAPLPACSLPIVAAAAIDRRAPTFSSRRGAALLAALSIDGELPAESAAAPGRGSAPASPVA